MVVERIKDRAVSKEIVTNFCVRIFFILLLPSGLYRRLWISTRSASLLLARRLCISFRRYFTAGRELRGFLVCLSHPALKVIFCSKIYHYKGTFVKKI